MCNKCLVSATDYQCFIGTDAIYLECYEEGTVYIFAMLFYGHYGWFGGNSIATALAEFN